MDRGPDAWLADLAESAREVRASARRLERAMEIMYADIHKQVRELDTKVDDLQNEIDDVCEARLRSGLWLHRIPTGAAWAKPMTTTACYLRYDMARPCMPEQPCVYHKSWKCKLLERLPEDHRVPLPLQWLEQRNHIWEPCEVCVASGVQALINQFNASEAAR